MDTRPEDACQSPEACLAACEQRGDPWGCGAYADVALKARAEAGDLTARAQQIRFLTKACDGGRLNACASLGRIYVNATGVPRDAARGRALLAKACDGGWGSGCERLAFYSVDPRQAVDCDDAQDHEAAVAWARKGCQLQHEGSCDYYKDLLRGHYPRYVTLGGLVGDPGSYAGKGVALHRVKAVRASPTSGKVFPMDGSAFVDGIEVLVPEGNAKLRQQWFDEVKGMPGVRVRELVGHAEAVMSRTGGVRIVLERFALQTDD